MHFKRAIQCTPAIKDAYCAGLQALRAGDRSRVIPEDARKLSGSLNIDDALLQRHPSEPRWDYGVAYKRAKAQADYVYWIEIHPARTSSHRDEVRAKFGWLKGWLAGDGNRLDRLEREFIWISSGESSFTASSPQIRSLA